MVIFLIYRSYTHQKNAASNIELFQEAAPHKAAAVWPPTIHRENYAG